MANGAGSRTDHDVVMAIRRLLRGRQYSPKQVRDILEVDDRYIGRVPDERTIRRIRRQMEAQDPTDSWRFPGNMSPEDARLVMDVLAWLRTKTETLTLSDGREISDWSPIQWISELEAEWIVILRRAYPDMPLGYVWFHTVNYIDASDNPDDRSAWDELLCLTSWRDWDDPEDIEREEDQLFWLTTGTNKHSQIEITRDAASRIALKLLGDQNE